MSASTTHDIEIDDGDVGRMMRRGSVVGSATLYVVVVLMGIVGGATAGESFTLGVWPAIVAGPFVGSVSGLAWLLSRLERPDRVVALRPPAPGEPPVRHAA